jgi:hypothetical protein
VTVPQDAQQMLVFLAPEAGGDFKTLMGAVRGRPGAFVRTSQDLNQAALDRSRLERYLIDGSRAQRHGPGEALAGRAVVGAQPRHQGRRKMPRPNPELQAPCLMAGSGVADSQRRPQHLHRRGADLGARQRPCDGSELHAAAELRLLQPVHRIGARYRDASSTPSTPRSISTSRRSVLRTATSSISRSTRRLRSTIPNRCWWWRCPPSSRLSCRRCTPSIPRKSTARDARRWSCRWKERRWCFRLRTRTTCVEPRRKRREILESAGDRRCASQGGFVVDTKSLGSVVLGDNVQATLRGYWGFDPYQGPTFRLRNARAAVAGSSRRATRRP